MKTRVRIEIDGGADEEVVIRCKSLTDDVVRLQQAIERALSKEMALTLGKSEYFVGFDKILFFESAGERVEAHTASNVYYTDKTLGTLCGILPEYFVRASKSCIINTAAVFSLSRSLTGVCEVEFTQSGKKAYVSRMYYRQFREKIEEMRLKK